MPVTDHAAPRIPMQGSVSQPSLDIEAIEREIAAGYIDEHPHPTAPLRILNYSQRTQFEWRWNAETMQCRGLIVDQQWNVVSRPFPKFFSVEQLHGVVPVEPFEAYEKLDGSLGILYFEDGCPRIATRGGFTSEQAQRASAILATRYPDARFDPDCTYLFEIIYPENRIVVDYGDREELVLLAIIETATGRERPLYTYDSVFPVVKRYDGFSRFEELMATQDRSREGFVVRFQSGQRVKIKFAEYKRLHRLLAGVSPKAVWKILRRGSDLSIALDRVPDEFFQRARDAEADLLAAFAAVEATARGQLTFGGTRKEIAERFNRCRYPSVMFAMLDGKDYRDQIWRLIRPGR